MRTDQVFDNSLFEVSDPENLPKKPTKPSVDLKQKMAAAGRSNLYYLTKVVLGYDQLVPHVHLPMAEFASRVKSRRQLRLMPRTHYKTTIWTISETIQEIIRDPNIRILMVADTGTNAQRFMREIQQHFQYNELFRWLYGEVIPENFSKTTWSQTEMIVNRSIVNREPTVDAIGSYGGIESRHYDLIKADDLVTEKHVRSNVEMDKLIRWVGGLESLLADLTEGRIHFIGSRKKKGDVYEFIEKQYSDGYEERQIGPHAWQKGELAVFWRRDIEDGKPIFPEKVPLSFLLRLKKWDPQRYHAQYANSPKGSGLNVFEDKDLRYWRWNRTGSMIECVHKGELFLRISPWGGERIILYDPSRAEKEGSSQNAIIVVLKGTHPFRIVLETHIGHYQPHTAIELLLELNEKWKPSLISVEHRGFQGAVKYWMHEKTERESKPMPPLVLWPPKGSPKAQWAKQEHIKSLQPLTRSNLVWLHETQVELIEQFEYYPNVRWDDGVDAMSQGLDYWPAMMDEADYQAQEKAELDHLAMVLGGGDVQVERPWDEEAFLSQLNATGYRFHQA